MSREDRGRHGRACPGNDLRSAKPADICPKNPGKLAAAVVNLESTARHGCTVVRLERANGLTVKRCTLDVYEYPRRVAAVNRNLPNPIVLRAKQHRRTPGFSLWSDGGQVGYLPVRSFEWGRSPATRGQVLPMDTSLGYIRMRLGAEGSSRRNPPAYLLAVAERWPAGRPRPSLSAPPFEGEPVPSMTASPAASADAPPLPAGQDLDLQGSNTACGATTPSLVKVPPAWRRRTRLALRVGPAIAVFVLLVSERRLIASSFHVVGHLRWTWFLLAVALESVSVASFARMQCRLLSVGTAKVSLFPVMATVYAGNALSTSVPVAGPQMSTAFVFRRFKQLGVDATVAGWTLVVAGVISSLASALLLAAGAILTGNDLAVATGTAGGIIGIGIFALTTAALRRPAVTTALQRPVAWALGQASRILRRPARDWGTVLARLTSRLASLRLPASGWVTVVAVAFLNWLADIGVLAASVVAVGAPVPWRGLLFAYGVGMLAQNVGILPGGLGVVEGALAVALMSAGVHHPLALAAVLVYRLISFWMVTSVGWLTYLSGTRRLANSKRARGNVDKDRALAD